MRGPCYENESEKEGVTKHIFFPLLAVAVV